jgi:hypothetical protein
MEQLLQMDCFSSATSLDHRPDLPPLKVSLSVVDPLGLPLTTRGSAAIVRMTHCTCLKFSFLCVARG